MGPQESDTTQRLNHHNGDSGILLASSQFNRLQYHAASEHSNVHSSKEDK